MLKVMKHISEMNGRFLTVETGKYGMTLTPPRASGRAAGSRLAGLLAVKPAGRTAGEPMKGTGKTL